MHRQRIARFFLVGAVCFGATRLWPNVPHTTDLRIELGPQHHEIMELQLEVSREGQQVRGASFRFPRGAPATVQHEVMLPNGRYEVQLRCRRSQGTSSVERVIEVPSEGAVRIRATGDKA